MNTRAGAAAAGFPGERVVGRGHPVGEVYRLEDGRTVIIRERPRDGASP